MQNECGVCVEPYCNVRKPIVCAHCNFNCCSSCVSTYLESTVLSPQCMQCHQIWTHQYIRENFGQSFVKRMADIRKSVLFNEQQALFPHTQAYIQLTQRLSEINNELVLVLNEPEKRPLSVKLYREKKSVHSRIREYMNSMRAVQTDVRQEEEEGGGGGFPTQVHQVYIKSCERDACKGYVNSETYTCELCTTEYCSTCLEEKDSVHHSCKTEDVLTISMLRKDTKNCPSCTGLIHRISGCPDMFCVNCKTAFNWNTLEINKRGNSNPHFYQWLRESAVGGSSELTLERNSSDLLRGTACNPDVTLMQMFRSPTYTRLDDLQKDQISHSLHVLHHYEHAHNLAKYYKEYNKTKKYRDPFHLITLQARVDYMLNKITKEKFTQFLLKIHKALEYNNYLDEIVRTIRDYRQHVMQSIVLPDMFDYDNFVVETNSFVKYMNKCMLQLEEVLYTKKKFTFISLRLTLERNSEELTVDR
jgi:hypothetical protein